MDRNNVHRGHRTDNLDFSQTLDSSPLKLIFRLVKRAQNRRETRQIKGRIIIQSRRVALRGKKRSGIKWTKYKKNSALPRIEKPNVRALPPRKFNVAPPLLFSFPLGGGQTARTTVPRGEFPRGFRLGVD